MRGEARSSGGLGHGGIAAALRAWAEEHGSPPSESDWTPTEDITLPWGREYPRWPSAGQAIRALGSWNQALEAAGFSTRRRRWDRESVIAACRAFAERHGRSPTTAELKEKEELPSQETIIRHLGSLDACRKALGAKVGGMPGNGWLPPVNQRWNRERIVEAIQAFAIAHGRPSTTTDWKRVGADHPGFGSVVAHFGSFTAGLRAAGLPPREKRWSEEAIIEAMREFKRETDFWPRSSDWTVACEDWPSTSTVYLRFGSWQGALDNAMNHADELDGV